MAAAIPVIGAVGGLAGGAASLSNSLFNKQRPAVLTPHVQSPNFPNPIQGQVGASLPTSPLHVQAGSVQSMPAARVSLPYNRGLYQGAQPFSLLTALQGFSPNQGGY